MINEIFDKFVDKDIREGDISRNKKKTTRKLQNDSVIYRKYYLFKIILKIVD